MNEKEPIQLPLIVKWAGGKKGLLNTLKKSFPKKIEEYYEPFVGGGAIFFHIKQHFKPKKVTISDINKDLVNVYLQVKSNTEELIKELKKHQENHSKEYYYRTRSEFNENKKLTAKRAANFIYLNRTCFNGLYRENSKGEFNVPMGSYESPIIADEKRLKQASKLLQEVIIKHQDFEETLKNISGKSFMYLDPPYDPLNETSKFTGYSKKGFAKNEQKRLAKFFREIHKKGSKAMLSNSNTEFIKKLYKGFKINTVYANRAINSKAEGRGKISELVITNY